MNKRDVSKLRTFLIEKCEAFLNSGGTIIKGSFGDQYNGCPLAVAGGGKKDSTRNNPEPRIAKKLKIKFTTKDGWDFILGFDGQKYKKHPDLGNGDRNLFDLGRELRKKYITKRK